MWIILKEELVVTFLFYWNKGSVVMNNHNTKDINFYSNDGD